MKNIHLILFASILLLLIAACSSGGVIEDKPLTKDENFEKTLVINELMATNRTGIVDENGELQDWVEIKNLTDEAISLDGFALIYEKSADAKAENTNEDEKKNQKENPAKIDKQDKPEELGKDAKIWTFPDMELQSGACLLVYASKEAEGTSDSQGSETDAPYDLRTATTLHANFNLSGAGGCVRLVSDEAIILSEVAYNTLNPNQVWRRLADGTHELSYLPTPGFSNDEAGYEAYNQLLEKQRNSPLRIWELTSKTEKGVAKWVELKNVSDADLEISDYALSTRLKGDTMWQLPAQTLKPGEICTVQLGKDKKKGNTSAKTDKEKKMPKASAVSLVADFKLDDDESVILTRDGCFADGLCAMPTCFGMSMGRIDKGQGFYLLAEPSRGSENNGKAYRYIAPRPTFSETPGPHDGVKTLTLSLQTHGRTVRYTLDGTEPTANSKVYKSPITLTKTTIVRAFAEGNASSVRSATSTATFFLNEGHHLPIVSVVIPKADLYDFRTGLMVAGPGGDQPEEDHKANYWTKNTERRAHVAFYDGKEGFETCCNFKVYGGSSRAQDKRSLLLKFNAKYGTPYLDYDVFNRGKAEHYTALILRGGSQDYAGIMARDEFFTSLMASQSPQLLVQDYRPVVLYLNDEYYGIYYLREKVNKNYVKRHLGVKGDSIDILNSRFISNGTDREFTALRNYAKSHDLRQKEAYDYVSQRINAEGFIDHFLGEFYASNTDLCNVKYVHSCNPKGDTRWHIIYYDIDESWNTFKGSEFYFSGQPRLFIHDCIMTAMLKNPEFRRLFLERTSWHMHHTFSKPYVTKFFNDFIDVIRPEMKRNCERWPDLGYNSWEKHLQAFAKNFDTRPKDMLKDLRRRLRITPEEEKKYFADLGF